MGCIAPATHTRPRQARQAVLLECRPSRLGRPADRPFEGLLGLPGHVRGGFALRQPLQQTPEFPSSRCVPARPLPGWRRLAGERPVPAGSPPAVARPAVSDRRLAVPPARPARRVWRHSRIAASPAGLGPSVQTHRVPVRGATASVSPGPPARPAGVCTATAAVLAPGSAPAARGLPVRRERPFQTDHAREPRGRPGPGQCVVSGSTWARSCPTARPCGPRRLWPAFGRRGKRTCSLSTPRDPAEGQPDGDGPGREPILPCQRRPRDAGCREQTPGKRGPRPDGKPKLPDPWRFPSKETSEPSLRQRFTASSRPSSEKATESILLVCSWN